MDRKQKKFELLKGTYNTLLVAILGSTGYLFANFHSLDSTRIIIGSAVIVALVAVVVILLLVALEE